MIINLEITYFQLVYCKRKSGGTTSSLWVLKAPPSADLWALVNDCFCNTGLSFLFIYTTQTSGLRRTELKSSQIKSIFRKGLKTVAFATGVP